MYENAAEWAAANTGQNSSGVLGGQGSTEQAIAITDIVSEGPIAGLVNGGRSIFLNSNSIYDDDEVGYTSVVGETISRDSSNTSQVIINEWGGYTFNYNSSSENQVAGKRYLLIHNVFEFIDQTGGRLTYNSTASSDNNVDTFNNTAPTYTLVIDAPDSSFSTINAATKTNLLADTSNPLKSKVISGDGIVTVWSKDEDRQITGVISAFSDTQISITLQLETLDGEYEWIKEVHSDGSSNLQIKISQFFKISQIQGKVITLSGPVYQFNNKTFGITRAIYNDNSHNDAYNSKVRSSGYQFNPGLKDQKPLQTITGSVGATSVILPPVPELKTGVPNTIVFSGAAAPSMDTIQLLFKYPGGLYAMNMDDGKKQAAGAGYVIHLSVKSGAPGAAFQDVGFLTGTLTMTPQIRTSLLTVSQFKSGGIAAGGVVSINGTNQNVLEEGISIFAHGGKQLAGVSFTHTINLEEFQPFSAFKLTIVRITESENTTDEDSGRAHSFNSYNGYGSLILTNPNEQKEGGGGPKYQAIQSGGISNAFGIVKERLNHPYTAMAHVSFSSRQYTNLPKRNYECYGLKVRIPKNYTPREKFGMITDTMADAGGSSGSNAGLIGLEQRGGLPNVNRLYTGLFTGLGDLTDHKVYTNNPAWVFFDILTNNRYGVGEYVRDTDIDIFSLYKIAKYCDELVPDGKGGVEPRFTANLYLQKAVEVYKVVKDMATIFRGMLYWMDGQLTPIMDEPKFPTYTFNRANIVEGTFNFEHTGTKTRVNQIVVKWNNPDNEYKIEPLFVEDRDNIVRTGRVIKAEATAFGCTSEGQAIRYGRWKLWTALNQTEIVSFQSSLNSAFLSPGDIVNIQDNHDFGYAFGGRVQDITIDDTGLASITFDRNLAEDLDQNRTDVGAAGEYKISLLLGRRNVILREDATINNTAVSAGTILNSWFDASGTPVTIDQPSAWTDADYEKFVANACDNNGNILFLENASETHVKEITCQQPGGSALGSVLTTTELSTSDKDAALVGRIWALKDKLETEASYKQFKILTIAEEGKELYSITAVEHYNTKFDLIETNFTSAVPDPLFPDLDPNSALPAPTGLRVLRSPRLETDGEELVLSWNSPQNDINVIGYQVSSSVPGYEEVRTTSNTSLDFVEVPDGNYTFAVSSFDDSGRLSKPAVISAEIEDFFGGSNVRDRGVLKGGIVSTGTIILLGSTKTFKYENNPVFFLSPNDTTSSSAKEITLSPGLDYGILSQYRTGLNPNWWSVQADSNNSIRFNKDKAFVFLQGYNTTPNLRLINYIMDPALNVDYWYDQTKATQKSYNSNNVFNNYPNDPDIWTLQTNQVTIANNSSKVVGTNTSFTTQYKPTSVIKFSESLAAKVSYIESDTIMYIDRAFEYKTANITTASVVGNNIKYTAAGHDFVVGDAVTISGMSNSSFNSATSFSHHEKSTILSVVYDTFNENGTVNTAGYFEVYNRNSATGGSGVSGATATTAIGGSISGTPVGNLHYRDELNIDYTRDFLIGSLNYNGDFNNFCTPDPDIARPRAIIMDSTIAALNYDGNSPPTQTTVHSGIELRGIAVGYNEAQFKVTGTYFGTGFAADADFVDVSNFNTGVFTKAVAPSSSTELIAYGTGTPLTYTIVVREKNDPDNPDKTITQTFDVVRIADGASGTEGRTVSIIPNDGTVRYAQTNGSPNPTTITFTARTFNFPNDAVVRFVDQDGTPLPSTDSNNNPSTFQEVGPTNTITFTYPVPNEFSDTSFPKVVEVEASLNVNPRVVSATDSTPLIKTNPTSTGIQISLPNNTVSLVADSNGVVATGTLTDTAATMEVSFGNTVGTYVGTNNNTANSGGGPTDANLNEDEWYISSVQTSDANLTAGNISYTTGSETISIAAASLGASLSGQNETITWTIKGRTSEGVIEKKVSQTLFKSKQGVAGVSPGAPADGQDGFSTSGFISSHIFVADQNGLNASNTFATTFTVIKGTDTYNYDGTVPYGSPTYRVEISEETHCVVTIGSSGEISITGTSLILTSGNTTTASFKATVKDNSNGNVITSTVIRLAKINQAIRDGGTFTFDASNSISPSLASSFAGITNFTDATARAIAQLVITNSNDEHITPNDRVTVTNGTISATRIYTGARIGNFNSVQATGFSGVVTQFIPGSAIVEGTLSASKLAANSIISRKLIVGEELVLGNGSSAANHYFHSLNKGKNSDGTVSNEAGFYMDGTGKFHLGDHENFLKFDGNGTFSLGGSMDIQGEVGQTGNSVGSASISQSGQLSLNIVDANGNPVSTVQVTGATLTKVVAIFSTTSNGANLTYVPTPNHQFVTFHEYAVSKPDSNSDGTLTAAAANALSGTTFVSITGDSGGVTPIYATSANGANAALNYNSNIHTHVHFYEWTGSAPTSLPSDYASKTYVEFQGPPGSSGSSFITADISAANAASTEPNQDTITSEWTSATGRSPIHNDIIIIVYGPTTAPKSKAYRYNTNTWTPATLFITGDTIVNGSITASEMQANSINASALAISNNASEQTGIYMDATNNRIEIYDDQSTPQLRVRLGKLS